MEGLWSALALSLLLTEAFELPFCALVWRFGGRELAVCALANAVTNPPVVLIHTLISAWLAANGKSAVMPLAVLILELSAVVVEWLIYRRCTAKRLPFFISLTANAFSYGMGLLLNCLI